MMNRILIAIAALALATTPALAKHHGHGHGKGHVKWEKFAKWEDPWLYRLPPGQAKKLWRKDKHTRVIYVPQYVIVQEPVYPPRPPFYPW